MLFYIAAIVGVGLFISSFANTQQQAILGAFVFMVPAITLSGFATPIANMPDWLQVATDANPVRYFLVVTQGPVPQGHAGDAGVRPSVADGDHRRRYADGSYLDVSTQALGRPAMAWHEERLNKDRATPPICTPFYATALSPVESALHLIADACRSALQDFVRRRRSKSL